MLEPPEGLTVEESIEYYAYTYFTEPSQNLPQQVASNEPIFNMSQWREEGPPEMPLRVDDDKEEIPPWQAGPAKVPSMEGSRLRQQTPAENSVSLEEAENASNLSRQEDLPQSPSHEEMPLMLPLSGASTPSRSTRRNLKRKRDDLDEGSSTSSKKTRGAYLEEPAPGTTWEKVTLDGIDSGNQIKKITYDPGHTEDPSSRPVYVCDSRKCHMTTRTSGDMRKHWQTSRHSPAAKYQCHPLASSASRKCPCEKAVQFGQVFALKRHLLHYKVLPSMKGPFDATAYMIRN